MRVYLTPRSQAECRTAGVLTQLSIVIGILVTQLLGMQLATPTHWRIVPLSSAILAAVQIVLASGIAESPAWLRDRKGNAEAIKVEERLWGNSISLHVDREADETGGTKSQFVRGIRC